ncbi:MAG: 4'-phosphopantetheinyl transferase superfamily protein [Bacteroidota bacterium]
MPLFHHKILASQEELGIWLIEEPEAWFRDRLTLTEAEEAQLLPIKGNRRREWLASRWLLHYLSGRELRGACLKDEYGKPYLEGSTYQISMSHSHDMTAVIAGPKALGVDIQFLVGKIERIAHKYMRPEEMDSLQAATRLEQLHVYWGAKEALYKAYGRRQLDFKAHIHIQPIADYRPEGGQGQGCIIKGDYRADFDLYYEQMGSYILVYGIEQ